MPVNIQFRRVWEEVEQDRPRDRTLEYVQQKKSDAAVITAIVSAALTALVIVVLGLIVLGMLASILTPNANANKTSAGPAPGPTPQHAVSPPQPAPCVTSVPPVTVAPVPADTGKYEANGWVTYDLWIEEKASEPPSVKEEWSLPESTPERTQPVRAGKPGGTFSYVWPAPEGQSTYTYFEPRPGTPRGRRGW